MNYKKLLSVLVAICLVISTFVACSSKNALEEIDGTVTQATDTADDTKLEIDKKEDNISTVVDNDGNVLEVVPVYNVDGVTPFAVYISTAKDKNGKKLDIKKYAYIQQIVGALFNEDGSISLKYKDNKLISFNALADKNGYIICIQDVEDFDKDKDTTEYFQMVSKLDSDGNLFLKLDKDSKGKLINVNVEKEKNGDTVVKDKNGNKTKVEESGKTVNPIMENKQEQTTNAVEESTTVDSQTTTQPVNQETTTKPSTTKQEEKTYTSIVLKANGKIACDDSSNVVNTASVTEGSEIVINGGGKYNSYYITSDVDSFNGQIEFRLGINEEIDVKIYNVNLKTAKKTAIKFTDVDKENDKKNDNEEQGTGNSSSGAATQTAAPTVNLSVTGSNSFVANGSGKNGTIYSECKLGIKGHGKLTVDGGQNLSGICSTESMAIKNTTINITSKAKQGISCDKKVEINGGANITINSKGDCIHCNKFNIENSKDENGNVESSTLTLKSLSNVDCADGIDADDSMVIKGGSINVVALTSGKYGLKVRGVNNKKKTAVFEISGGTVYSSAFQNTAPTLCSQQTLLVRSTTATQFVTSKSKSADGALSYLCSPCKDKSINVKGVDNTLTYTKNLCNIAV